MLRHKPQLKEQPIIKASLPQSSQVTEGVICATGTFSVNKALPILLVFFNFQQTHIIKSSVYLHQC